MSLEAFEQMKTQHPLSRDRRRIEQVQRVGERLARVVFWDMPNADWEFVVFDEPREINAFAMAGGKVGVFSGLFAIVDTDDELATVLAHEIAHVTAKHINERLSHQNLVQTGGIAVGTLMATSGAMGLTTGAVLDAYGLSTSGGVSLAFDRQKEEEADRIGLIYMARAGFDPEAAVRVMEKLDAVTGGQPIVPAFLSNHPPTPDRIARLNDEMPQALAAYQASSIKQAPVVLH